MKANVKEQNAGKNSVNYSNEKSLFANDFDTTLRGWNASVKLFNQMYKDGNKNLLHIMQQDGLKIENFTKDFLNENIPARFNNAGCICRVVKIDAVEAEELKKGGLIQVKKVGETWVKLVPITKFTGRSFYNLFKAAENARKKGINQTAKMFKAAERQKKDAERLAKLQAEIAKLQNK